MGINWVQQFGCLNLMLERGPFYPLALSWLQPRPLAHRFHFGSDFLIIIDTFQWTAFDSLAINIFFFFVFQGSSKLLNTFVTTNYELVIHSKSYLLCFQVFLTSFSLLLRILFTLNTNTRS